QVRALQPQRARRVGPVARRLVQGGLDEAPLEVGNGAVVADGTGIRDGVHDRRRRATRVPRPTTAKFAAICGGGPDECPARWAECTKTKGPRTARARNSAGGEARLRLRRGLDPGMILEELLV